MPRTVVENPTAHRCAVPKVNGKGVKMQAHERIFGGIHAPNIQPVELRTIGPFDTCWKQVIEGEAVYFGDNLRGCIVRLVPPAEAEDVHVELVETVLRTLGVATVKVLPRPRSSVLPRELTTHAQDEKRTARQVVMELVKESNSQDKKALTELVEGVLSKAGL